MNGWRPRRVHWLVASALVVVVVGGRVVRGQAAGRMESQLARAAVAQALAQVAQAQAGQGAPAEGSALTPEQKGAFAEVILPFETHLCDRKYEAAWALIHPDTQGTWTRQTWVKSQEEADSSASGGQDAAVGVLLLGKAYDVPEVVTAGDRACAHVIVTVDTSHVIVLRKKGQNWAVDLAATEAAEAQESVRQQFSQIAAANALGMLGALGQSDSGDVPSLDEAINRAAAEGAEFQRAIVSAKIEGDRARVTERITGQVHFAVPVTRQGRTWSIMDAGEQPEILRPGQAVAGSSYWTEFGKRGAKMECQNRLKQLALGFLMYAQDYDERMPMADRWCDQIFPYVRNETLFTCPADDAPWSYAMNYKLSRGAVEKAQAPYATIALFESEPSRKNAYDKGKPAGATLANPPRHGEENNFAWLDGHVSSQRTPVVDFDYYRVTGKRHAQPPPPGLPTAQPGAPMRPMPAPGFGESKPEGTMQP